MTRLVVLDNHGDVVDVATRENMQLPDGVTCGDCTFYTTCSATFGCSSSSTNCDWSPRRFRRRETLR